MDIEQRHWRRRQAEATRNDRAVLEAARVVFAVHGPDAPVAAIAERAGVGVGSLYRRYTSKADLIQSLCLLSLKEQADLAKRATRDEPTPWDALRWFIAESARVRSGALTMLAGSFVPSAETLKAARLAQRRASGLLRAAQRSGDVRADVTATDLQALLTLLSRRAEDDPSDYERLLAVIVSGLRPGGEPLPGAAAPWRKHERQWTQPPTDS